MNEYDALNKDVKSIITKVDSVIGEGERVPLDPTTFISPNVETIIQPQGELIQDNSNGLDTLKRIISSSTSNRYKALAEALLPFASINTQVKVGATSTGFGTKVSGFFKDNTITIDNTVPAQEKERVFMHEMVHAITLNKIRPYYSQDADGFYTVVSPTAPSYVKELDTVWKEYIKNTDPVLVERAKKKTIDLRNKRPALFSTEELEIGYPAIDIFEFFAVALESETFQKHLSSIPMDKATLMDKFIDVIRTVLSEIGVSIEKGSLAEKSLSSIFNFIENEAEVEKQKAIFASINANISAEELAIMDRALAEEQERISQLPPDNFDPTEDSNEAPDETLMPASEELLSEVGLTQEQWASLSKTEKTKIKDCK
jgi:hypothetical protein